VRNALGLLAQAGGRKSGGAGDTTVEVTDE
jgi:hypothetical protein